MKKLELMHSFSSELSMDCCRIHGRWSPEDPWCTFGLHFEAGAWFLELPFAQLSIDPAEALSALSESTEIDQGCECILSLREELVEML